MLAELLKNTPAVEDKEAEASIERVLVRFKNATREINDATNDPSIRARIQRSWQLQYLLQFPRKVSNTLHNRDLADSHSLVP